MGYACPVCETAQADAAHLANHLAFTAMLGDDAHEAWLDERVPDWADRGPETLGPAVAEYAPEREHEHDHGDQHDRDDHAPGGDAGRGRTGDRFESELARHGGYGRDAGAADGDLARVLEEARDLTERMGGTDPLGAGGEEGERGNERTDENANGDEEETAPDGASEAETE